MVVCILLRYLHKVQVFMNGLASYDFGLRCNRFPYMSPYTIKNYFFKCTNSDATCMDPFKRVLGLHSFISV